MRIHEKRLKNLGDKISYHRRRRGLTIEQLSMKMSISKGNLSDIENGKKDPRYLTLLAIAEGLDLKLSTLIKEL